MTSLLNVVNKLFEIHCKNMMKIIIIIYTLLYVCVISKNTHSYYIYYLEMVDIFKQKNRYYVNWST